MNTEARYIKKVQNDRSKFLDNMHSHCILSLPSSLWLSNASRHTSYFLVNLNTLIQRDTATSKKKTAYVRTQEHPSKRFLRCSSPYISRETFFSFRSYSVVFMFLTGSKRHFWLWDDDGAVSRRRGNRRRRSSGGGGDGGRGGGRGRIQRHLWHVDAGVRI